MALRIGSIVIKRVCCKNGHQVLPYTSAISTDSILPRHAADWTLGHYRGFLFEERAFSSPLWQRPHFLQLQLQYEVSGFNDHKRHKKVPIPIQVWTSSTKCSGSGGDDLAGVQWSWPCLAHCLCLGGDRAEGGRSFEQNSFRLKVVVWAPKFDSYSDDVPIHLPREEPSHLTKFTLDLVSLSVTEEKVIDGWWLSMTWPASQLWICLKWFLLSSPSLRFLWLFMIICPLLSFCLLAWWKDQAPLHKCPLALSTWGFFISHFPLDLFQSTNTAIESGLASSEDNLTIYHEMMIICLQGLKVPPAGRWEESWWSSIWAERRSHSHTHLDFWCTVGHQV